MPTFPAITAGQRITAGLLTSLLDLQVTASADQSAPSTTLVTDNALALPVAANAAYSFSLYGVFDGAAAGGLDIELTVPAGAVLSYSAGAAEHLSGTRFTGLGPLAGAGVNQTVILTGTLTMGGTAGTLQFLFAQNANNGTATRRRAGSRMSLRRIS